MKRTLFLALIAIALSGCGGVERATVEGLVTLDGKPLPDVEVQFIPEPGSPPDATSASAYTDDSGRYRIQATSSAGACVGPNRVCINDARVMMPGRNVDPNDGTPGSAPAAAPPRSRVPDIYSDATRTPFRNLAVTSGVQTVDLTLKVRP